MKTVLITGVSRGNGAAFARKFLAEGWHVIGTSRSGVAPFNSTNFTAHALDLSQPQQIDKLARQLIAANVKVDVIINNAGINLSSTTEYAAKSLSVDTLQQTLQVNLIGLADFTEQLLDAIPKGQIITISSGAGASQPFIPAGVPSYQISKAALNMYTRTLAERLRDKPVAVWAFDPGWVKTDMGGDQATKLPETAADELYKLVVADVPSGTFWAGDKQRQW